MHTLPVVDLSSFLAWDGASDNAAVASACASVFAALAHAGALLVRDPRVSEADNAAFLDMMERYFAQSEAAKAPDVHPELAYQVGATPELVETPRSAADPASCAALLASQPAAHRATPPVGPDPKWRFFWRLGPRPSPDETSFPELAAPSVVPTAFASEWAPTMDAWGTRMLAAVHTVAEMAALGAGLERPAFTSLMANAPHLLAPTGSDLGKYTTPGTVFAGYHYDLNFLTVHGKSRFPGLAVWLRDGTRLPVVTPPGCLLLQAGKQLEWLTGGEVKAGYHEVVLPPAAAPLVEAAKSAGRSTWRVSSTVFAHIAYDATLRPLGKFAGTREAGEGQYPPTKAGQYVNEELAVIKLKA